MVDVQKVVRRPWDNSERSLSDAPAFSGTKRSRAQSNAEDSLLYTNKRLVLLSHFTLDYFFRS